MFLRDGWRAQNRDIKPDLIDANLSRASLIGANLREANVGGAHLSDANLWGATSVGQTLTVQPC